jgi:orotate phosphoribosyltransferase
MNTYSIYKQPIAQKVAESLLAIEAIKLNHEHPFTWSSGWKSPIYCDNRLALSFPDIRSFIKEQLAEAIKGHYADAEAIAGVATAGIPQGALVADYLGLPFLYVRSKPKGHGMENMIEGKVGKGQKVVVVEDLVSTGGSSLAAVNALRSAGAEVLGMVAIFTYGFPVADQNFEEAGVPLVVLSDYSALLQHAQQKGTIKEEQLPILNAWRNNPQDWTGA